MVNRIAIIIISLVSFSGECQSLSMGVSSNTLVSQTNFNSQNKFDIMDDKGDTLILSSNAMKLSSIFSIPIYARYNSKKNWWIQISYGYENWRLTTDAETNYSPHINNARADQKVLKAWQTYQGDISNYNEFYNTFHAIYAANETNLNRKTLTTYEQVQYNKISLGFGSSFNNKAKVKIFYGAGVDMLTFSTSESYQGLVYENNNLAKQYELLENLPKLNNIKFGPYIKFGLEKQNLRLGFDMHFFNNPTYTNDRLNNTSILYNNELKKNPLRFIVNYGLHINYTVFNQNIGQKIDPEKMNVLDPEIIGKYKEKIKLLRFGFTANFPSFRNSGWSALDEYSISEESHATLNNSLKAKSDFYLHGVNVFEDDFIDELSDNIYLEKKINNLYVNESGLIDTNEITKTIFFGWGNINTVIKSPKITGFASFSPFNIVSFELNAGYQRQTLGVIAYEKEESNLNNEDFRQIRKLLYQENFHEISIGLNNAFHKNLNNTSKVGFHLGLNYNMWLPGKFKQEKGGVNDSELLSDFHDYFINGENQEEWNENINSGADKGIFSKQDYYDHQHDANNTSARTYGQKTYHTDFSNYLFNTIQKRNFYEIRFGLDYYIEKYEI